MDFCCSNSTSAIYEAAALIRVLTIRKAHRRGPSYGLRLLFELPELLDFSLLIPTFWRYIFPSLAVILPEER